MRMGFERWEQLHSQLQESDLTGYRLHGFPLHYTDTFTCMTLEGPIMITFKQITEIESIRRQIEQLQRNLSAHSNITTFGWIGANDKWRALDADLAPYVKEIVCKVTVAKIVKLLDEAAHLGVDTGNEKKLLFEFLQELIPKDPTP